jgi:hypothetical protein
MRTGLAFREQQRNWQPGQLNAVILVSDGGQQVYGQDDPMRLGHLRLEGLALGEPVLVGDLLLDAAHRLQLDVGHDPANWTLVAGQAADEQTMADLAFAWKALRPVKSRDRRPRPGCDRPPASARRRRSDGTRADRGRSPPVADLAFAWKALRPVKSNAILLADDGATVGIGEQDCSPMPTVAPSSASRIALDLTGRSAFQAKARSAMAGGRSQPGRGRRSRELDARGRSGRR